MTYQFCDTFLYAVAAFLTSVVCGGCGSTAGQPAEHASWDYIWDGEVKNLTGCPEGERFLKGNFIAPTWEILRWDEGRLVIVFQIDGPATAVLCAFDAPRKAAASGRIELEASTQRGSVRAWLVRMPAEMFDKTARHEYKYNVFRVVDRQRLLAIVDASTATTQPVDGLAYPMIGRAQLFADAQRVRSVSLELRTDQPMPVYEAYAKTMLPVLREFRGQFRDKAQDDREIEAWQSCLDNPRGVAPAVLKGSFRGSWVRPSGVYPL